MSEVSDSNDANSKRNAMKNTNLLLLPGTQCDERLWTDMTVFLPEQIICHHWAIPQQSLEEVLEALHTEVLCLINKNEPMVVLGFSLGGYLLSLYLTRYTKVLAEKHTGQCRFIICSNTPTALPVTEIKQRRRITSFLTNTTYQGVTTERVCQLIGKQHHHNDVMIDLIKDMDKTLGKSNLLHQLSFTGPRENCLAGINNAADYFDVVFVLTQSDPLVDYEWLQNLSAKIQQVIIEGEGHMLPLEYPLNLSQSVVAV